MDGATYVIHVFNETRGNTFRRAAPGDHQPFNWPIMVHIVRRTIACSTVPSHAHQSNQNRSRFDSPKRQEHFTGRLAKSHSQYRNGSIRRSFSHSAQKLSPVYRKYIRAKCIFDIPGFPQPKKTDSA